MTVDIKVFICWKKRSWPESAENNPMKLYHEGTHQDATITLSKDKLLPKELRRHKSLLPLIVLRRLLIFKTLLKHLSTSSCHAWAESQVELLHLLRLDPKLSEGFTWPILYSDSVRNLWHWFAWHFFSNSGRSCFKFNIYTLARR